jgi:hypothetical protein
MFLLSSRSSIAAGPLDEDERHFGAPVRKNGTRMLALIGIETGVPPMNGYSLIFMVVFLVALALTAGAVSWGLVRGVSRLSHHPLRKHGHRH